MRTFRLVGVLALVGLLMTLNAGAARAQVSGDSFTLQPGGKAKIAFEAFCIEFGEVFPGAVKGPDGVAADAVRAALAYAKSKGLNGDGTKALQMQYAVWQALGEKTSPKGDAMAQDVVTNGTKVPTNPTGTSFLDAAKANQVRVTLDSWQPIGPKVAITSTATDNFYGRGQITIENISQSPLTLYMPVGTIFPSVDAAQQTMAGYATDIQVTNPQAAPQPTQLPTTGGEENAVAMLLAAALLLTLFGASTRLAVRRS